MTLEEFNSKFLYKSDIANHKRKEYWKVIEPDEDGIYAGDCEDFALTVRKLIPKYADWDIWFCKVHSSQEGHAVLRKNDIVLCNMCKYETSLKDYEFKYMATSWQKYWKIAIWYKMTMAKLYRFIDKDRK